MVIAIYTRKSKITNKGDSIESQKEVCRNYINCKFKNEKNLEILEYSDEGFSGKNLVRPDFQKMMIDITRKNINCIIVYRLDRISRDVADFAELYKQLSQKNIQFISTTEDIDTTTVSGKAMLMMISVFSQFERETIAERIRDNLYSLSQKGYWLGGNPPYGFISNKKISQIEETTEKTYSKLIINPNEIEIVKLIYLKYLETHSQSAVEKYLLINGFKSRKGDTFKKATIKNILMNPVYCCADKSAYNYFCELGSNLYTDTSNYNGKAGLMPYLRTYKSNNKQTRNSVENWTISVGKHPPIINSKDWIRVQELLKIGTNKSSFRKIHNEYSIFSGLIYCTHCGKKMLPRVGRINNDGIQAFSYVCETKLRGGVAVCNCTNANGRVLDEMLCNELINYTTPTSSVCEQLKQIDSNLYTKQEVLNIEIAEIQKSINSLKEYADKILNRIIETTGKLSNDLQNKYDNTLNEIELKNKELDDKKRTLFTFTEDISTKDKITDALAYFKNNINSLPINEKRDFVRKLVNKIEWDGENAHIFLLGALSDK